MMLHAQSIMIQASLGLLFLGQIFLFSLLYGIVSKFGAHECPRIHSGWSANRPANLVPWSKQDPRTQNFLKSNISWIPTFHHFPRSFPCFSFKSPNIHVILKVFSKFEKAQISPPKKIRRRRRGLQLVPDIAYAQQKVLKVHRRELRTEASEMARTKRRRFQDFYGDSYCDLTTI